MIARCERAGARAADHVLLAGALRSAGRREAAEAEYRAALRLEPARRDLDAPLAELDARRPRAAVRGGGVLTVVPDRGRAPPAAKSGR
jgi:hypothetical protein